MRPSSSKRKMSLRDLLVTFPYLMAGSEAVRCINRFFYLISPDGLVSDETLPRIQKTLSAFAKFNQLWRRGDIRLPTERRVYCSAVSCVLLYQRETWPLKI